ncbi:MAG: ammonium permease [Cyanobacteria bacterium P01_A01_bin.116]
MPQQKKSLLASIFSALNRRPRKSSRRFYSGRLALLPLILSLAMPLVLLWAHEAAAHDTTVKGFNAVGTVWLMVASALVFFMNAGFAMLETGFCRTGNAVNVLAKNLIVFCVATLAFWLFGFRFMLGDSTSALWGQVGIALDFPFPSEALPNPFPADFETLSNSWPGRPFSALFFFQLVFAGTAATIVSGAIAERVKFWAFLLFSFFLVGLIYPLVGYWVWGGGWLSALPFQFRDFAGSAVVHSVGGTAALVGAIITRPRQGKFGYDAKTNRFIGREDPQRFEPYNLSLATLGCLILWLGWFGFNGGSTVRLEYVPHILTTTFCAAAAGGVGALVFSPSVTDKKARLSSIINGLLGGLVGITASSAYVDVNIAIIIGASSSLLVLLTERYLEKWRIDDPVGAIPVHLVCGGWGTLAVGLFGSPASGEYQLENYSRLTQILYQALGWTSIFVVTAIFSLVAWIAIGIVLYVISPKTEIVHQEKKERVRRTFAPSYQEIGIVPYVLYISRRGLRVPPALEERGGTPTLLP